MASVDIRWIILLVGGTIAAYLWLRSRPSPSNSASLPEGLYQVYPDPKDQRPTDIDIIAVHGLDTTSPDTWTWRAKKSPWTWIWPANDSIERDVNWLADSDMLPEATGERARIFMYNWPAKLFQKSIPTTLEQSAQHLLGDIEKHLRSRGDRPILFIASCLGGIILIKALEIDRHKSNSQHLVKATRGIVFLATPFHGTSFKDMPSQLVNLWAWLQDQTVTALMDYTKELTPELDELVRRFVKQEDKDYHVFTFFEAVPTNLLRKVYLGWMVSNWMFLACPAVLFSPWLRDSLLPRLGEFLPFWLRDLCSPSALFLLWMVMFSACRPRLLVDESSATAQIFERQRLERRHVQMNKFHGSTCKDYERVAQKINAILEKIRKGTPLFRADDWIRKECYAKKKLEIQRLSGECLSIDQCYINLAIVTQPDENRHRSTGGSKRGSEGDTAPESSPFSLSDRLKIETPENELLIELPTLFNSRKMPDGQMKESRRILIRGRAGVGKTTLCKKIVYDFMYDGMWNKLFDRVLWVRLRKLKDLSPSEFNNQKLFEYIYFERSEDKDAFAKGLHIAIHSKTPSYRGTLFLLDGLDEVSELLDSADRASSFLQTLLNSPNVIITTRPHTALPNDIRKPDLELETIGFHPNQVQKYLDNIFRNTSKVEEIQSFLQKYWLLQSLVRIPIQLDALCLTWDEGLKDSPIPETMTGVYRAIVERLWRKDTVQLGTKTDYSSKSALPSEIEKDVRMEKELLEFIAFSGLYSNVIEFQPAHQDVIYKWLAERLNPRDKQISVSDWLGRLSFLRTSDPSADMSKRSYHFLHLTFQEYFAARYFVRQWESGKNLEYLDLDSNKIEPPISPKAFLQQYKYTARYDIVWRFIIGSLDPEKVSDFFEAIEQEPLDLVGPTHQRLVMHCLSEVGSSTNLPTRSSLETKLSQWLLFECDLTGSSLLVQESEFPDQALRAAMETDPVRRKVRILKALQHPGRHLSEVTAMTLISELQNKDGDRHIRLAIVEALGCKSTLSEAAVTAFIAVLKNKHEGRNVQFAAAEALKGQSPLSEAAIAALIAILNDEDKDTNIRWPAAQALEGQSTLSEAAVTALIAVLKDKYENWNIQLSVVRALGGQSTLLEVAITAFIAALADKDNVVAVRSAAAKALEDQPTLSEAAVAALIALFEDEDEDIRHAAARVLGSQSTLSEAAIQVLIVSLEDEDKYIRQVAAQALASQSTLPEAAVTAFIAVVKNKDEDKTIRSTAASALENQSTLSEVATPAFIAVLKDRNEDIYVRVAVAERLGSRSTLSEAATTTFITLLKDEEENIRLAAAEALGSRSNLSEAAVTAIIAVLKDENKDIRLAAAEALSAPSTLPEAAVMALIASLKDRDRNFRLAAAEILGSRSILSEAAVTAIIAVLADDDKYARWAAAQALGSQSTLSDKILEAIGLLKGSEGPAETKSPAVYKPQFIEALYGSLLFRSFREHFSLCVDINTSQSSCIINQQSGLQQARWDNSQVLTALTKERQIWNEHEYNLWNRLKGDNTQQ
ncbi:ARM repeat-containing protein [Xylariaceae sp. AK1471]|nr:ARM repeat-containing protein [Xylariaceae sp. AK1471]